MFDYSTEGDDTIIFLKEIVNKKMTTWKQTAKPTPDAGNTAKIHYSYINNCKFTLNSIRRFDYVKALFQLQ